MTSTTRSQVMRTNLTLTLRELHPGRDCKLIWWPFEATAGFNPAWWCRAAHLNGPIPRYFSVVDGKVEVARIELEEDVDLAHYGAPELREYALEIQFIEVHDHHRGRGIGREVVRLISKQNPGKSLVALSEDADGFWSSLGWERIDHPDGPEHYRPLFVQPLR